MSCALLDNLPVTLVIMLFFMLKKKKTEKKHCLLSLVHAITNLTPSRNGHSFWNTLHKGLLKDPIHFHFSEYTPRHEVLDQLLPSETEICGLNDTPERIPNIPRLIVEMQL